MAKNPVDMRKGFDGLCSIVRNEWNEDVFSGYLFVFMGARRDRVKILHWDDGGFVLYYKRLERGRFKPPRLTLKKNAIELDATELAMLLDGIDIKKVIRGKYWRPYIKNPQRGSTKAM